jgi:hypothetical protein
MLSSTPQDVWVWLDPDTAEEMSALEECAAQGEWTTGRGREAIPRLQALATRLGHPVGAPEREATSPARPRLVVVQRQEHELYRRLVAMRWAGVRVIMDRRRAERRTTNRPPAADQRRQPRRRSPPTSRDALRFFVVPPKD